MQPQRRTKQSESTRTAHMLERNLAFTGTHSLIAHIDRTSFLFAT
jgi:hypothetical protein